MKIELWCDVVCPFCGLTEQRLENALAAFEHRADVQVVHRSFQLHPELQRVGITQHDLIVERGLDPAEIEKNVLRPIEEAAKREGLANYRAIDRTLGPTDHAHELLAFASAKGLHAQAWRQMFRAHFGEARKFWTIEQCVEFATELGLDATESRSVLENRKFRERVEDDQREAQRLGAAGTPFMLIDRKYPVPGARSTEELLSLLRRVWHDRPSI